jgi:hypothetical protein
MVEISLIVLHPLPAIIHCQFIPEGYSKYIKVYMTRILRKTKNKTNFTSNRFCVKFVFFHYVFMNIFDKGHSHNDKFFHIVFCIKFSIYFTKKLSYYCYRDYYLSVHVEQHEIYEKFQRFQASLHFEGELN